MVIRPVGQRVEKTYSAPFATHLYNQDVIQLSNGKFAQTYIPLVNAGVDLDKLHRSKTQDILIRSLLGLLEATITLLIIVISIYFWLSCQRKLASMLNRQSLDASFRWHDKMPFFFTLAIILSCLFVMHELSKEYYIFGTDKVGQDVFYVCLKSIRTGVLIGTLTTLVMLPFAILLGMMAGYFGGIVDDIIQYIYTTLSSIPAVLLIAASILSIQIFIANHPELFRNLALQADARLLALCIILGITSWTSLCRILRAETLKLREIDYIHAAKALGTKNFSILTRHILPNVMHIVIITVVLDFSGLVLAEAVLSYVGIGVDPTMMSWGNMINSARLELAREPVVWWPLLSAFIFMFILVLSANVFSNRLQDAFDPRLK
jgi:peptide/nickel transport system permease protein